MDLLCADKTSTQTPEKIGLARCAEAWGAVSDGVLNRAVHNTPYQTGLKHLPD